MRIPTIGLSFLLIASKKLTVGPISPTQLCQINCHAFFNIFAANLTDQLQIIRAFKPSNGINANFEQAAG